MLPIEIIHKKVNKKEFNQAEANFMIEGIVNKTIPDYQITAWLMAIYINKLTKNEAYYLTNAMWKYSEKLDFSNFKNKKIVDKHSTGGIGDKVTLVLAPIIASLGYGLTKFSGKGLGFTGGTIDKLAAINVNTELSIKQIKSLFKTNNMFVAQQSANLDPADKILYALRDVTRTVNELGLIAASVLSKKFTILGTHVYLDVKYGSGAFCKNDKEVKTLVEYLTFIAKKMKRNLTVFISSMQQPLGRSIGNGIEIKEAIDFLNGDMEYYQDLKQLIFIIVRTIIKESSNKKMSDSKIDEIILDTIKSKKALNKFYSWIKSQGANLTYVKSGKYFKPKYSYDIKAKTKGYVIYHDISKIGFASTALGAGRIKRSDIIDNHAGIFLNKKSNDLVNKNEIVATLYSSKPIKKDAIDLFNQAYSIKTNKAKLEKVIKEIVYND